MSSENLKKISIPFRSNVLKAPPARGTGAGLRPASLTRKRGAGMGGGKAVRRRGKDRRGSSAMTGGGKHVRELCGVRHPCPMRALFEFIKRSLDD